MRTEKIKNLKRKAFSDSKDLTYWEKTITEISVFIDEATDAEREALGQAPLEIATMTYFDLKAM